MQKSNIEWCTHSWNPVTGCYHNCDYCYARKFSKRIYKKALGEGKTFEPHLWENRIDEPIKEKNHARIFVSSMGDLFGDFIPTEWILKVLASCVCAPQHTYYFLTKNPKRYFDHRIHEHFKYNPNFWMGFSAETGSLYHERWQWFQMCDKRINTFVSIEPMLDGRHVLSIFNNKPDWVIVGAQTKPDMFPGPNWIQNIRNQCKLLDIPLFEKNSLAPLNLEGGLIQEIP